MSENEHFSKKKYVVSFLFTALVSCFFVSSMAYAKAVFLDETLTEEGVIADTAQQTANSSKYSPEVVTVIGSRLPSFKVPFSDVPANVSYLPLNSTRKEKDELYLSKPRSLQESVRDIESAVLFDQVGNGVDATFGLRGFNEGSSVVVLVDGVRVNEVDGDVVNYPLLDLSNLEAIQVDRGSASPIFGNNAFAGVLHLTTGRPSPKPISIFGGYEYSSFGGNRFYNGVSGTLEDKVTGLGGQFGYYFNGSRNLNSHGFRDNGEFRITSFDIKTEYTLPDEEGRIFVHVKHVDDAISNPGSLTFQQFKDNAEQSKTDLDGRYMKSTIVALGADKSFWDNRIMASVLASSRYNETNFYTTFQTFTDFPDGFNPDTNLVETDSRAKDLILQLAYQDEWNWLGNQSVMGVEMRDASNYTVQRDAFEGIIRPTATEANRSSTPRNIGLYWRESLNINDVAIVHFGMRHDRHSLKTIDRLANLEISERWAASTLSTGITLKPVESVDVFANYSQGFRVPTISEIAPFSGTVSRGLNPEFSNSYEVGTRLRIKDKAQAKASFFLIDLKDEILFDSTSRTAFAPFGQNRNVGQTRREGLELRLDTHPIEELDLYGSYTWTQTEVRKSNPAGTFVSGRSLGQIPEHRLTMGATLQPLKRMGEKWEGLKLGLYGVFTGKQHPQSFESSSAATLAATGGAGHFIKSYSVWDFILSYELAGQEIYFKVNNLFDEKYISRSIDATSFGTALQPAGTFSFVNSGAPREFLVGARWEFDSLNELFS